MAVTIKTHAAWRKATKPAADYGFFGPGSVVWKVWTYPTAYILAFACLGLAEPKRSAPILG